MWMLSAAKMSNSSDPWQFVNISEPNQSRNQSLRNIVRANATRTVRRRQKQSRTASLDRKPFKPRKGRPRAALMPSGFSQNGDKRKDAHRQATTSQDGPSDLLIECGKGLTEDQSAISPALRPSARCKSITNRSENVCVDLHHDYHSGSRTHSTGKQVLRQSLSVSPRVALGAGNRDPFNSCPLGGGAYTSELLHHCRYYFHVVSSLRCRAGAY